MNIYDFKVKNNKGEEVSLSDYLCRLSGQGLRDT